MDQKIYVVECVNLKVLGEAATQAEAESRRDELQATALAEGFDLTQKRYGTTVALEGSTSQRPTKNKKK